VKIKEQTIIQSDETEFIKCVNIFTKIRVDRTRNEDTRIRIKMGIYSLNQKKEKKMKKIEKMEGITPKYDLNQHP
jgi:hypothetical protein